MKQRPPQVGAGSGSLVVVVDGSALEGTVGSGRGGAGGSVDVGSLVDVIGAVDEDVVGSAVSLLVSVLVLVASVITLVVDVVLPVSWELVVVGRAPPPNFDTFPMSLGLSSGQTWLSIAVEVAGLPLQAASTVHVVEKHVVVTGFVSVAQRTAQFVSCVASQEDGSVPVDVPMDIEEGGGVMIGFVVPDIASFMSALNASDRLVRSFRGPVRELDPLAPPPPIMSEIVESRPPSAEEIPLTVPPKMDHRPEPGPEMLRPLPMWFVSGKSQQVFDKVWLLSLTILCVFNLFQRRRSLCCICSARRERNDGGRDITQLRKESLR